MRVLSWNINGLRASVNPAAKFTTLEALLNSLQADVICLQETKLRRSELERELALVDGWDSFFSFTRVHKTGYSGVATFCRRAATVPVHAEEGFTGVLGMSKEARLAQGEPGPIWEGFTWEDLERLDSEGRCVMTDHGGFVLFNVYGPAISSSEAAEERMAYKMQFYQALERRMSSLLAAGRRVVLVGDLNLSPELVDSAYMKTPQEQQEFLSRPDKVWLRRLLSHIGGGPYTDIFRAFHPDRRDAYTCWSTASGARVNNYGSRIDHILIAEGASAGSADGARGTSSRDAGPAGAAASTADDSESQGLAMQQQGQQQQQQQQQQDGALGRSAGANVPDSFLSWFVAADIWHDYEGSDHAPVWADLQPPAGTLSTGHDPPPIATRYAFTGRQCSIKQWAKSGAAAAGPQSQASSLRPLAEQQQPAVPASSASQSALQSSQRGALTASGRKGSGGSTSNTRAAAGNAKGSTAGSQKAGKAAAAAQKQQQGQQGQKSLLSYMKARGPAGTAPPAAMSGAQSSGGTGLCASSAPTGSLAPQQQLQKPAQWQHAHQQPMHLQRQEQQHALSQPQWQQMPQPQQQQQLPQPQPQGQRVQQPPWQQQQQPQMPSQWHAVPQSQQEQQQQQQQQQQLQGHWQQADTSQSQPHWQQADILQSQPQQQQDCPASSAFTAGTQPLSSGRQQEQQVRGLQQLNSIQRGTEKLWWAQPQHEHQNSGQYWQPQERGQQQLPEQQQWLPNSTMSSSVPSSAMPQLFSHQQEPSQQKQQQQQQQQQQQPRASAASAAQSSQATSTQPSQTTTQSAQAQWARIQQAMQPPKCKHGEPCVIHTVKKRNENYGRQFYCCARPDGLPPEGRCKFWQWANDRRPAGSSKGSGGSQEGSKRHKAA